MIDIGNKLGMQRGHFVRLWIAVLLGASQYQLLVPLVPLILVERGGNAALVGLAALAFSLPSIVFRPSLGRAVDRRGSKLVTVAGEVILALSGIIFAMPSVLAIFVGRAVQGVGWAALNTGGYSLLARLAPSGRRGEAAGYYSVATAIAQLVMPGLGIALYAWVGYPVPLVIGSVSAIVAVLVLRGVQLRPEQDPSEVSHDAGLTERSALLPMTIDGVNAATQSLFTFFMPVIVLAYGIPVEALAVYYPIYGGLTVTGRLVASRISDRVGRERIMVLGISLGLAALLLAAAIPSFLVLVVAGCLAAIAGSFLNPTLLALTIDRAPPGRIGAAVATYSLGYQLGAGLGGAAWGVIFSGLGISSPFVVAAALHVAALAFLRRQSGRSV